MKNQKKDPGEENYAPTWLILSFRHYWLHYFCVRSFGYVISMEVMKRYCYCFTLV